MPSVSDLAPASLRHWHSARRWARPVPTSPPPRPGTASVARPPCRHRHSLVCFRAHSAAPSLTDMCPAFLVSLGPFPPRTEQPRPAQPQGV